MNTMGIAYRMPLYETLDPEIHRKGTVASIGMSQAAWFQDIVRVRSLRTAR